MSDGMTSRESVCESRLRYADAVARAWIVGLMRHDSTAAYAHPLAMVRAALAGETNPVELGCDEHELLAALRTDSVEELREALNGT